MVMKRQHRFFAVLYLLYSGKYVTIITGGDLMTDILIVEDDRELADLLTDFLRAEGYTVSSVYSGERAVQLFERYGTRLGA